MKNWKKTVSIILAVIAVICVALIAFYYWQQYQNHKLYEEMQKQIEQTEKEKEKEEPPVEEPEEDPGVEIPIDFESLWAVNDEIYAWIQIDGTDINYPILQSATDDSYYLNHTVEREYGYPGAIFTESCNSKEFTEFNTVIYGHNMLSGNMFQHLHDYSDPAFMLEHPTVIIYTPDKKLEYRIFAAIVYDNRHIMKSFDFTNEQHRQSFLESIYSSRNMANVYNNDVEVTTDSRIITLSTCVSGDTDHAERFLVEAVLESERPRKADETGSGNIGTEATEGAEPAPEQ